MKKIMILAAIAMMSVACCKNCNKNAEEGACCAEDSVKVCCCDSAKACCGDSVKCCCAADTVVACCEASAE